MSRRSVRKTLPGGNPAVSINRSASIFNNSSRICICAVVGLLFVLMNVRQSSSTGYIDGTLLRATNPGRNDASITSSTTTTTTTSSFNSMKEWRASSNQKCHVLIDTVSNYKDSLSLKKKEELERSVISQLELPTTIASEIPLSTQKQPYARCKNVFIDLGTNIGDSVGYFIDNAIDPCSPVWAAKFPKTKFNVDFPRPHLNVTTLHIEHGGNKGNPLFGLLQKQAQDIPSESFCVYGMEGNPTFTERLRKLENFIREVQPPPVQHVHIFTESVVTAQDGPTKLYLDKTSVEKNVRNLLKKHKQSDRMALILSHSLVFVLRFTQPQFWGSSILSSQQDAVKSAKELNDGRAFSADVTGISLSSMVKNTVMAFKEGVTAEDKQGGLLIIKMDVEGAEYQVLKEVSASGVLCEYIQLGNRVVFVVEYHNMSITDPRERKQEKDGHQQAVEKLEQCGVDFQKLHAFWA
jgi:hypothetical protein